MKSIKPTRILYIKLGEGGKYEEKCIKQEPSIKIGFREVPHELCINKKWDEVKKYYIKEEDRAINAATGFKNQLKEFYESDENTLWITFYKNKLWWCFCNTEITLNTDKTKTRTVIGQWSDKDINGNILDANTISGKLLKTQGFRGTICNVEARDYALNKINDKLPKEVRAVENMLKDFEKKVADLIKDLSWQDFETLIDLIFRQGGWQRMGAIGKQQKTLDLDLYEPITRESALVQIKSKSNLKEFQKYIEEFDGHNYNKFFYIVHSPDADLKKYINETEIKLYFDTEIAKLSIDSGLVAWIIKKVS